jgi:hypothetical protein
VKDLCVSILDGIVMAGKSGVNYEQPREHGGTEERLLINLQNTIIFSVLICIFSSVCRSTMVGNEKRICPVCDKDISVLEWGSYGSYIYERESKYDLIYFPYDNPKFIWMCNHCGYTQAKKYFTDLSQKEKGRLKEFLSSRWQSKSKNEISIKTQNDIPAIEARLTQAILINKFLEKDDDFWAWFNRVLIFQYRKINPDKAKTIAEAEIELLKKNRGEFDAPEKNRAYLLGEYNRLIGNKDLARNYFFSALKVDTVSEVRNLNTALLVINFLLFISLLFLWIRKAFVRKNRIIFTIVGIIVFAVCSVCMYWTPTVVRHRENKNNYYNKIIYDRINLLDSQSE